MELREALAHISHIRQQMARAEVFRGYRSLTLGCSAVLAFAAAWAQSVWLPHPAQAPIAYLTLWVAAAVVSAAVCGGEMFYRAQAEITSSPLARQMTVLAFEQFLPSLVAGGLVTFVIAVSARQQLWMLPGLWAVLFSLGIFASYRLLPRAVFLVGAYYLMCGVLCLVLARDAAALSPWAMALSFGVGQSLWAVIIYWTLERKP